MGNYFTTEANWKFYQNKQKSNLYGVYIDDMLQWSGDYDRLESTHDFIQWLFPIPDSNGVNHFAHPLKPEEAKSIRDDQHCYKRVLKAYKMMLDFYGMKLKSINSGEIDRSDNYIERYMHLNRSSHNYRRITRILKSLGHLGYEHFQFPWVDFLINEVVVNKELPNVSASSLKFWVDAVQDYKERDYLFKKLSNLSQSKEFHEYESYYYKQCENSERHKMAEPSSENKCQEIINSQDLQLPATERDQMMNVETTCQPSSDSDDKAMCTTHQGSCETDNKTMCTIHQASCETDNKTMCTTHQASCETDNKNICTTHQASETDDKAMHTDKIINVNVNNVEIDFPEKQF